MTDPEIQRKKERLLCVAVKELDLANAFQPNDAWTLKTLAYCYKILEKKEQELHIMQNIVELFPTDKNMLYQLATLYFEQGETDKGLRVYDTLKQINPKYAKALLRHYRYSI